LRDHWVVTSVCRLLGTRRVGKIASRAHLHVPRFGAILPTRSEAGTYPRGHGARAWLMLVC
jgi:hypothetical protein